VSASADPVGVAPAVVLDQVGVARRERLVWSQGTFSIPRGSMVIVIGPNGSGKTTLLELLLGLVPPASGRVEVLGGGPQRGNRRIGYVPQNYTATIGEAVGIGIVGSVARSPVGPAPLGR
jgi:zinc/manganese transport system ATP-binding protein